MPWSDRKIVSIGGKTFSILLKYCSFEGYRISCNAEGIVTGYHSSEKEALRELEHELREQGSI